MIAFAPAQSDDFTGHSAGSQGAKASSGLQWKLWSACVHAKADLSLRWAHMQSCRKYYAPALFSLRPGPEVIKLFSCSTQLSMKFSPLISMKMPTIVGIFIFMRREIFMLSNVYQKINLQLSIIWYFLAGQISYSVELSTKKKFYNLGATITVMHMKSEATWKLHASLYLCDGYYTIIAYLGIGHEVISTRKYQYWPRQ